MAEFKISRIRYTWRNVWTTGTDYNRDDIIRVGSKTYVCLVGHTAASSFYSDLDDGSWTQMSEGSTWRGEWQSTTLYNLNDLVYYGGVVWICSTSHTSQSTFDANLTDWTEYISTAEWNSDWLPNTRYGVGDLVKYNGIVYRCVTGHTSSSTSNGLEVGNNDAYQDSTGETWEVYSSGIEYRGDWDNAIRYRANDLVKYGGSIWKCVTPHTSGDDSTLNFNSEYFTIDTPGEQFQGNWDDITTYNVGDVVRYGGYLYVARRNDINEIPSTETAAWTLLTKNYNVRGEWSRTTDYKTGDVVRRGGQLFVATGDNSGAIYTEENVIHVSVGGPGSGDSGNKYYFDDQYIPNVSISNGATYTFVQTNQTNVWYPNATGTTLNSHPIMFSTIPESVAHPSNSYYTEGVVYYLNELEVTRQEYIDNFATANTRKFTLTVTSQTPAILYYWCFHHRNMGNQLTKEVTTLGAEPSTGLNWSLIVPGDQWRGGWTINTEYAVGDLVAFSSSTYRCITSHRSVTGENFPTNGNGFNYWTLYLSGDDSNALSNPGDLLTYGNRSDESTLGTIAVPVGTTRELLTVNDNTTLGYVDHGAVRKFLYVAPHGVDEIGYGLTLGTPFKTIRYAAEYAEQNFAGAPTTISVKTGHYYEILPIIIPENTAIVGDETRSVIVEPAAAITNLSLDANYTTAVLGRMKDIMVGLLSDTPITPTAGNTVPQNTEYPIAGSGVATTVSNLIDDITDYINYHVNSIGSSEPTLFGSVTETTNTGVINGISILEGNKEFLAAESVAYMRLNFPSYSFDSELCKRDIYKYIDAWEWDLRYSSNYKSLLAARYYRNAILGSEGEDMFYARNATGVRNMTLQGLQGELADPVDAELFQRPTGGAFVSLDPGWGPADERCWINSRSPYIQNCCTFGYGTVGQKIDGSLHDGGYKSMVSNDFTQIISDGIGAYVLNGGRAELVSVFTYYSQIGYFAEDGGVIRATNGNNSYGVYGAIASGNDPTETPYYANVNNENNEAIIIDAFAGEVNDEILAVEFAHCGQNYTTATYTFIGSGSGASVVQEDFRDNAIYQARLISANGIDSPGGGGYTEFGNNAQEGNTLTIKLASNDPHSEAEVLGLRLIITSGTGTGQYGYIQAYNELTKVATIYKESTNEPGWDHIVSGYPIVDIITTSAVYRVEPRVTFSDPGFTSSVISVSANTSWANVVYSETYETYTNIAGSAGTGTIDIELTPVTATWDVIKDGRSYIVSINNVGAGYADGQTITISGSLVGGEDTEHDISITITEISDDSTNSIVGFVYEGIASSGRFVATPSTGTSYAWSLDGETWTTYTLPTSGNWKALAAGDKTYVAAAYNSSDAVYSKDGKTWTTATMPASRNWTSIAYGNGVFLAVANNSNIGAYSINNGATWTAVSLPSGNQWADVTYGAGKFVAVENDTNIIAVGTYESGSWTWDSVILDVVADSTQKQWTSIAYGNNRYVVISNTGEGAWSFDGTVWYPMAATNHTLPHADDSTEHNWQMIRYGQGVFFAIGDTGSRTVGGDPTTGPTTFAATSPDGIVWTKRTLPTEASYVAVGFGNPDITLGDSTASNSKPTWIVLHNGTSGTTNSAVKVYTGARALGRVAVTNGIVDNVKLWDPGSGYTSTPTLTITDPSNTADLVVENRLGDGVLAQPSWINRGASYKTSSTTVTVTGDGFANILPTGKFVTLDNLDRLPSPGAQFRFAGATNYYTVVTISQEGVDIQGKILATFRISPTLTVLDEIQHNTQVEIREQYSQIRITGHDFLDIGTGNLVNTNYPTLYSTGLYLVQPENEVYEKDGGRVFYTSTDQDGNFRTGELFAVEQATGVVTISADFFNLEGLTELALGGVRLGGSGTVIREFSTDPLFIADSNNVVPTQRAIKAYLQARLSVGGSDLQVPSFIAGVIWMGPTSIRTTTGVQIELPARMEFGSNAVKGTMLAQTMFIGSFNND